TSTRTAPNASSSPRSRSRRGTRRGGERAWPAGHLGAQRAGPERPGGEAAKSGIGESRMTIAAGPCSITFPALDADGVLALAVRAGVEGIEWGADGHVPPGGGAAVEQLGARCRDAGVEVVSYGSYLGFGPANGEDPATVDAVLDSAEALGAPM